jgi:hypothetical protein
MIQNIEIKQLRMLMVSVKEFSISMREPTDGLEYPRMRDLYQLLRHGKTAYYKTILFNLGYKSCTSLNYQMYLEVSSDILYHFKAIILAYTEMD